MVEDDSDDALLMDFALKRGCPARSVKHVIDGAEAIEYLRARRAHDNEAENSAAPLILLDLKMPRQNGFEVLEWLRQERYTEPRVIVITGSALGVDREKAMGLGAREYHEKKTSLLETIEMVKGLCERWLKKARLSES